MICSCFSPFYKESHQLKIVITLAHDEDIKWRDMSHNVWPCQCSNVAKIILCIGNVMHWWSWSYSHKKQQERQKQPTSQPASQTNHFPFWTNYVRKRSQVILGKSAYYEPLIKWLTNETTEMIIIYCVTNVPLLYVM